MKRHKEPGYEWEILCELAPWQWVPALLLLCYGLAYLAHFLGCC